MNTPEIPRQSFWALTIKETLEVLATQENGLSETEAKQRQARVGNNTIPSLHRADTLQLLLEQLKSPLIFLLLLAGVITLIVKDL